MTYTPPANDAVDFELEGYTPPANDAVDFEFGAGTAQLALTPGRHASYATEHTTDPGTSATYTTLSATDPGRHISTVAISDQSAGRHTAYATTIDTLAGQYASYSTITELTAGRYEVLTVEPQLAVMSGRHTVYQSQSAADAGQHTTRQTQSAADAGQHTLYGTMQEISRGVAAAYASLLDTSPGRHAVMISASARTAGQHTSYEAQHQQDPGRYTVFLPIADTDPGRHTSYIAIATDTRGLHRSADDAASEYRLYRGIDAEPDITSTPWQTSDTLPITTPALDPAPAGTERTYYFVLRSQNKHSLESKNLDDWTITVDDTGSVVTSNPTAPQFTAAAADGGNVSIDASYLSGLDDTPADTWAIYAAVGSDPSPPSDLVATIDMTDDGQISYLDTTIGPYSDGEQVHVLVRTSHSSDGVESENTTAEIVTIDTSGIAAPEVNIHTASVATLNS